jgi:MerR family mercuric resistance operon transcriptional regulator
MAKQGITIGALAGMARVSVQSIRFYERKRILPTPARNPGGHRMYEKKHLDCLLHIKRLQGLGFTIREIGPLLKSIAAGHEEALRERFRVHLESLLDQRSLLNRRISFLRRVLGRPAGRKGKGPSLAEELARFESRRRPEPMPAA